MRRLAYGLSSFPFRWQICAFCGVFGIGWILTETYGVKALFISVPWGCFLGHLATMADMANKQRER